MAPEMRRFVVKVGVGGMGIKEKEIEDLVCQYPESILGAGGIILGRQVPLVHGRLDVLGWNYGQTYVIEIKAAPLQEKDIGQVLRYTHDVSKFLFVAFSNSLGDDPCFALDSWRGNIYADKLIPLTNATPDEFPAIQPMLIGKSASDSVRAAAEGAHIDILIWSTNEERTGMSFTSAGSVRSIQSALARTPPWASRIVAMAQEQALEETEHHITYSLHQLFK